jgi:hypothetical protein
MIGFLAVLAINVGLTILGRLLTPKVKRPERPELELPFSEEGVPVAQVYGTQSVNPTLMAAGDRAREETNSGMMLYFAKLQFSVCQGPVHILHDVQFGEKSLALWPSSNKSGNLTGLAIPTAVSSVPFPWENPGTGDVVTSQILAFDMFGGYKEGGGIAGKMNFVFGEDTQDVTPLTEHFHEAPLQPTWPTIAVLELGGTGSNAYGDLFYHCANSGQLAPIKALVSCFPHTLLGTVEAARIGWDANPAEIVYELLNHWLKGSGLSASLIDTANLTAKAQQYKNEGLGMSITVGAGKSLEEIKAVIDDICKACDAQVFQHPITGLFVMEDARSDEDLEGMEDITPSNSFEFELIPGQWKNTFNEFKLTFNEFLPGLDGDVEDELLTSEFHGGWDGEQSYQLQGRNIDVDTLVLYNNTTEEMIFEGTDYIIEDASQGWVQITDEGGGVSDGDVIYASYTATPTLMGFRDGVVQAKNNANLQRTREVRTLEVDYPMFTSRPVAQRWVNRIARQQSVPVRKARWKMNFTGHSITPISVVKINRPLDGLVDFRMRILDIDYGHLEEGYIVIEASEDIFGDDMDYGSDAQDEKPDNWETSKVAPAMAIGCMTPGAIRIALFPSDEQFRVEVQRADDLAFTVNVTTIYTQLSGLPTPDYIDDTQTVGTTKYYRARHIRPPSFQPGPWTEVLACTASAGTPPEETECVIPTWTLTKSETEVEGTATLLAVDGQSRIQEVRYSMIAGPNPPTEQTAITAPYEVDVPLLGLLDSSVTFFIDYLDCDSQVVTTSETVTFSVPQILALVPTFDAYGVLTTHYSHTGASIRIAGAIDAAPSDATVNGATALNTSIGNTGMLATATEMDDIGYVKARAYAGSSGSGRGGAYVLAQVQRVQSDPAEESLQILSIPVPIWAGGFDETVPVWAVTSAVMEPRVEWRIPLNLTGYKRIRIWGQTVDFAPTPSTKMAAQYWNGSTWVFFDTTEQGPWVRLGGALDMKTGLYYDIPVGAQGEVLVRVVFYGGSGTSASDVFLQNVGLTLDAYANTIIPVDPEAPTTSSSPCGSDIISLSADDILTWQLCGCGTFQNDGTGLKNVDQLDDKAGHGNHLSGGAVSGNWVKRITDASGNAIPQISGRDPISFEAAWLQYPAGMFTGIVEAEFWVVIRGGRGDPNAIGNYWFFHQLNTSGGDSTFAESSGGVGIIRENFGTNTLRNLGDPGIDLSQYNIYRVRAGAGLFQASFNGAAPFFTDSSNTVAFSATPRMGNRGNNSDIEIPEILITRRLLETAEGAGVLADLQGRYGL